MSHKESASKKRQVSCSPLGWDSYRTYGHSKLDVERFSYNGKSIKTVTESTVQPAKSNRLGKFQKSLLFTGGCSSQVQL